MGWRLFLLPVCIVGAAVLACTPGYLHGHARLGQLMGLQIAFTLAMIGAILADDLLLLLFCEAKSVLSFLLAGFGNDSHDSRESARWPRRRRPRPIFTRRRWSTSECM